jgi:hypothetical protein
MDLSSEAIMVTGIIKAAPIYHFTVHLTYMRDFILFRKIKYYSLLKFNLYNGKLLPPLI